VRVVFVVFVVCGVEIRRFFLGGGLPQDYGFGDYGFGMGFRGFLKGGVG